MLNYKKEKKLKQENYYLRNKIKSGPRSQPMFSGQIFFPFSFRKKKQGSIDAFKNFLQQQKQEARGKTLLKIHT
jgi:hypothetical protein